MGRIGGGGGWIGGGRRVRWREVRGVSEAGVDDGKREGEGLEGYLLN